MSAPVLYSFRRCPYAMRARMALHVSGVTCELREVVLRDKPEAFVRVSPKATVPVLQLDDRVIEESRQIMVWALGHNDPEQWLLNDEKERRDSEGLIDLCDGPFKIHLDRYKYTNRYPDAEMQDHRSEGAQILDRLNDRLTVSTFLHGDRQRITDVAIAPFVRQFANTDRPWFDAQSWTGLVTWLNRFTESQRFVAIMHKYAPWESGAESVFFPVDNSPAID